MCSCSWESKNDDPITSILAPFEGGPGRVFWFWILPDPTLAVVGFWSVTKQSSLSLSPLFSLFLSNKKINEWINEWNLTNNLQHNYSFKKVSQEYLISPRKDQLAWVSALYLWWAVKRETSHFFPRNMLRKTTFNIYQEDQMHFWRLLWRHSTQHGCLTSIFLSLCSKLEGSYTASGMLPLWWVVLSCLCRVVSYLHGKEGEFSCF